MSAQTRIQSGSSTKNACGEELYFRLRVTDGYDNEINAGCRWALVCFSFVDA